MTQEGKRTAFKAVYGPSDWERETSSGLGKGECGESKPEQSEPHYCTAHCQPVVSHMINY